MGAILLIYILMNVAYCLYLKRHAIVDVFVIATGFVLRIVFGGLASGVTLTHWIVLMVFLLALLLAFAKRRDDVVLYEHTGQQVRHGVEHYSLPFLDLVLGLLAAITIVCYILYTVSPEVIVRFHSPYVYLTSIFVLGGIIRYLQLTIVAKRSGSPTKVLLTDHCVQACILLWVASFAVLLYL